MEHVVQQCESLCTVSCCAAYMIVDLAALVHLKKSVCVCVYDDLHRSCLFLLWQLLMVILFSQS